jgi:sulfite reductase alpha subunit-like flavoprotein
MSAPSAPLVVLYGSQTGAAKGVAELVHAEALARGLASTLAPANAWDEAGLLRARAAVVVVSTTGDGDAPTNAEDFLRFLRRRTHARDLFARGPRVAVLRRQPLASLPLADVQAALQDLINQTAVTA